MILSLDNACKAFRFLSLSNLGKQAIYDSLFQHAHEFCEPSGHVGGKCHPPTTECELSVPPTQPFLHPTPSDPDTPCHPDSSS